MFDSAVNYAYDWLWLQRPFSKFTLLKDVSLHENHLGSCDTWAPPPSPEDSHVTSFWSGADISILQAPQVILP